MKTKILPLVAVLFAAMVLGGCAGMLHRSAVTGELETRYAEIDAAFAAGDINAEKRLELKNQAFKSYSEGVKRGGSQ